MTEIFFYLTLNLMLLKQTIQSKNFLFLIMEKQHTSSEPRCTLMVTLKKIHSVYQMLQICERNIFTKFLLKLGDYEQLKHKYIFVIS